jgi:hypothetical protein
MKKMMKRVKAIALNEVMKVKGILNDTRAEGYIDTAVFPEQDSYDRMNTIEKLTYKIKKWKFKTVRNLKTLLTRTRVILADQSGQGALDQVVSILISIVLGALLLAGLYALFADTLLPLIQERVMDIFDYAG